EGTPSGGPRVQSEHNVASSNLPGAGGRPSQDAYSVGLAPQRADASPLVDQRASSGAHGAKPTRQPRGVDRPGIGHQGTGSEHRGSAPLSHFGRAELVELVRHAELSGRLGRRP